LTDLASYITSDTLSEQRESGRNYNPIFPGFKI